MKKSIKTKMLIIISVSVFLLLLVMQFIIIRIVSGQQEEISLSNVELEASKYAEEFNNLVSRKLELSKSFASYVEVNSSKNRQEVMNAFKNELEKDKEIIDNFLIYEPGAFDGRDSEFRNKPGHDSTGRFNFTYNRYSGSVQVAPVVDVDISDYYTVPKKTLQPMISEPYLYQGTLLSTFSAPILKQGEFIGTAGVDLALNDINKIINQVKIFDNGYAFVLSKAGMYIATKDQNLIGKSNFFEILKNYDPQSTEKIKNDIANGKNGYIKTIDKSLDKEVFIFYASIKSSSWSYAVVAPVDEMMAGVNRLRNTLIIIGIIAVALIAIIAYYISLKISKPIVDLTDAADKISSGDLNIKINATTEDEIGRLIEAFNRLISAQKDKLTAVEKIAEGKLERVELISEKDILAAALNKEVATIEDLLAEINKLISEASEGNLSARASTGKFNGAWNKLISGINSLLDEVVLPVKEGSKALEVMSGGDLTFRIEGNYKGDFKLLMERINHVSNSLNYALTEVRESVEATASAANQISSSTEEMASGASEQNQQVLEITSSIEEMAQTIIETSKNASSAADNSRTASESAKSGVQKVEDTKKGMRRIVDATRQTGNKITSLTKKTDQIGEITQVIDDIADQTNLLALNAAIEAARAGEQGRGFAVVADEVRKLAERTTKATKEIADTINSIQQEAREADSAMNEAEKVVQEGLYLTEQVADALRQILEINHKVSDVISLVAAASEEQSSASEEISKSVESISNVTEESAAGVQQIARAAQDLSRLTINLQGLVSKFTLNKNENHTSIIKSLV